MPFVRGFKAFRYNPEKIDDFASVIVPPYDIVNSELRDILSERSKYNFVHIDLPTDTSELNRYENAGKIFKEWQANKIFIRDTHKSAYWLRQRFTDVRGVQLERLTLLALVKIPQNEDEEDYILPHEKTFDKPIEDRISLMRSTHAQLSPVFMIFSDREQKLLEIFNSLIKNNNVKPEISVVTIDGVFNELWKTPWSDALTQLFYGKKLYIADGHHRFKTARQFLQESMQLKNIRQNENEYKPYCYLLTGLVAFEDPGLVITAPHRVIKDIKRIDYEKFYSSLSDYFNIIRVEKNPVDYLMVREQNCSNGKKKGCCFGFVDKNYGRFILELKEEGIKKLLEKYNTCALHEVDVFVLHKLLFEEVLKLDSDTALIYETNPFRCIEMVELENYSMAFLINPILPQTIKKCADCREFMPQKSTYFFPKIPSGLVVYELSEESI